MLLLGCLGVVAAAALPVGDRLQKAAARQLARGRLAGGISLLAVLSYLLVLTGSPVTRSGAVLACPALTLCGPGSAWRPLSLWTRVLHLTVAAAWWAAVVILWTVVSRGRSLSRAETEPTASPGMGGT